MACDAAGKAAFSFWSNIGVYISHVLLGKLDFAKTVLCNTFFSYANFRKTLLLCKKKYGVILKGTAGMLGFCYCYKKGSHELVEPVVIWLFALQH